MNENISPTKSPENKKQKLSLSEQQQTSPTAISSNTSMTSPVTTSTPQGLSTISKQHKPYIYHFIENLFKINMSQDALVDIIINDDPTSNQTTIVGRPKLLGSSTTQMRHVTPYSFVEHAIKGIIQQSEGEDGYKSYIKNIVEATKPLIQSKQGICLTSEQYQTLLLDTDLQTDVSESFKLMTITQEKQKNEYHLIYNEALITQFESSNVPLEEKEKAKKDFVPKFTKYINHGIEYLTDEILNPKDLNSIIITCEGLARIILTMFNQDKYAAFPQEGNSLLEEIRLYNKDSAKQAGTVTLQKQKAQKLFEVKTHDQITKEITDQNIQDYNLRIRIVDNEGAIVKKAAEALNIINFLVTGYIRNSTIETVPEISKYEEQYNSKYNIKVNVDDIDKQFDSKVQYQQNLKDIFHYHVAKHLYSVFDFKPLETKVLAPKQKGDIKLIKVYPSTSGDRIAEYSIQDGIEYRKSQINAAKGYNKHAIFRSEMNNKDTKDILQKEVIKHVQISLIPFKSLREGCTKQEELAGIKQIFNSFIKLVQQDYNKAQSIDTNTNSIEINLDNAWVQNTQEQYETYNTSLNLSGVSESTAENYDI